MFIAMMALALPLQMFVTPLKIVQTERMSETAVSIPLLDEIPGIAHIRSQSSCLQVSIFFSLSKKACEIPSVLCNDGTCVDLANVCDTTLDCPDQEDEIGCRKL